MVRSVHRDEFHRHGDINVTSLRKDISLQRIAGLKRNALMMSLSGAELGTLTEGGFWPCQALENYDSAGSSARVKQIVAPAPDLIRREPTFDLEDPVQFQEVFRASRVINSTWCRSQHSAGHSERWSGPSAFVNRQKQDGSMASRARS